MKKIYLLGLASLFTVAVTAQTTIKVKNPIKKRTTSATEKTGPNSVSQIAGNIVCNTQYVANTTMNLELTFNLTNTDFEYCDSLAITFPTGITPNSSPNNPFASDAADPGPDGPEALNPIVGQLISWGNDDNNWGGIVAGAAYNFTVNVTVAPTATGSLNATFHASGDGFGGSPGSLSSSFTIYEAGSAVVDLTATFVQPLNLTSLNTCSYGLDTIVTQIKNLGTTTETNIIVACTVNGVSQTSFTVPTLAPNDSAYVFFLPAYNFNAATDYALVATVSQASDINLANDTAKLTFNNSLPVALTTTSYSNGCEAGFEFNSLNRVLVSGIGYIFGPSQGTFQSGAQALFYTVPNSAPAGVHEAMVILPCLDVTSGDIYRITFYKRINGSATTANGQSGVFTGLASDPAAMTTILKPYTAITPYAAWIKDSVDFTATATETRYFALGGTGAVVAGSNQINVRYDNINIMKLTGVGVNENTTQAVSVFPNPNNGIFTISAIENNSSVEVYNVIGENVYSSNLVKGNNSINLSTLAAGSYVVKVMSGTRAINKHVVINK